MGEVQGKNKNSVSSTFLGIKGSMYDSLVLWLPSKEIPNRNLLLELSPLLKEPKQGYDYRSNSPSITGYFSNFSVKVTSVGILLSGSICKYYLGNNQQTLRFDQIKAAIDKLSKALNLPLAKAQVYRIDIGENYMVSQKERIYYSFLGPSRYYRKTELNNGVYFTNQRRVLIFYGKVHEQSVKGVPVEKTYRNKNVLRYECRFKRKLSEQLGKTDIKGADLYDQEFYINLLEMYKKEYLGLHRYSKISFNPRVVKDVKSFQRQLLLLGVKALGGEASVIEVIDQCSLRGAYSNKMQKRRLREDIRKLCKTPLLTYKPNEIEELDELVKTRVEKEINSLLSEPPVC